MLTRLEIYGVLVLVALLAVGGSYWYVKHLQHKVATLENEVAGLKLQGEIIVKAQEATDKTVKAMQARSRKNVQDKTKVDTLVESGNTSAVDKLWLDRGMYTPKTGSPSSRPPSGAGDIPAR